MGEGFPFLDIVLFAMVAAFIILRLRGVLGRRPGNGRTNHDALSSSQKSDEKVIKLPDRAQEPSDDYGEEVKTEEEAVVESGLRKIREVDNQFMPAEFLEGARAAYEMIVTAYAVADEVLLQQLLSDEVYDNFVGAIQERIAKGHTLETTLLDIRSTDIVEARLVEDVAEITVKFVSDVINVTREEDGTVVSGDPDMARDVTDFWTFARDTHSSDPNWKLVETRSPQ
tara:strand:- start:335 stop:1015 length:681 start_codon:yes stop_codon:yes gene_type:complete